MYVKKSGMKAISSHKSVAVNSAAVSTILMISPEYNALAIFAAEAPFLAEKTCAAKYAVTMIVMPPPTPAE